MTEKMISGRTYTSVFAALLVLTLGTYELAKVDLGHWNTSLGLAIAAFKAILVILYFMHVRYSTVLVRIVIVAGLFWLAILLTLTMNDYMTRLW